MASVHKRATKGGVVYDVRYRDLTGAGRQKSFRRKAEADKFRATVVADMARGDWIDPRRSRETVADRAAKWIASKSGLKPSSLDRCQVTLEMQILPRWADTPIGKVMHEDVVAWIAATDGDGLSASSIKKARGALREILAMAVRSGAIRANPVDGTKVPTGPKAEHRYLGLRFSRSEAYVCCPARPTRRPPEGDPGVGGPLVDHHDTRPIRPLPDIAWVPRTSAAVDMCAAEPAFWDVQLSATVGSEQGECGKMAFCPRSF